MHVMSFNILIVNPTDEKNLTKFEAAKELNLMITLVGDNFPLWLKPFVDHYICSNTADHKETIEKIKQFNLNCKIDGVITFWDREVELVSLIAQTLNLPGTTFHAIQQAKNKLKMRLALEKAGIEQPKFCPVNEINDLYNAAERIGYPFIFKPVAASNSTAILKISHADQILRTFKLMQEIPRPPLWLYPNDYLAEEFLYGNEVSVEGFVNNETVYIAGITQKWITFDFVEYQHCFPANLPDSIQQKIKLYTMDCINAIGLKNTAFHVELKINEDSIKVVEINARMGGDFITSHLLPLCGIDIAKNAILTALSQPVEVNTMSIGHACIRFLLSERAGQLCRWNIVEDIFQKNGVRQFGLLKQQGDNIMLPPSKFSDNRLCYVITHKLYYNDAITAANEALSCVSYDLESFEQSEYLR